MSLHAELGSVASTLEAVLDRLDELVHQRTTTGDDDGDGDIDVVALALLDVERSLRAGSRRLERLVRDLEA